MLRLGALLAAIAVVGCNLLASTAVPTIQPTPSFLPTAFSTPIPSVAVTAPLPTATGTGQLTPVAPSGPYAVVLVPAGDVLNIRAAPGASSPIVGSFGPTSAAVIRTGPSAAIGSSLWVEVERPGGGTGWVNQRYLTDFVAPVAFCGDGMVSALLDAAAEAFSSSDGSALASLVSPIHGLDVRVWRWGTVANYSREEAQLVFDSTYEIAWGPAPGSGLETNGSFREVVLPRLLDVLSKPHEPHCNDALDLATFALEPWPAEYTNVNFQNLYRLGSEQYGGLDWRAWLAGVEYVDGKPYLFALIHFQWEP